MLESEGLFDIERVLTPGHAKRLLKALHENIKKFEQAHGEVKDLPAAGFPMNFGTPTTEA
jgi:copper homeostasis protein CutC